MGVQPQSALVLDSQVSSTDRLVDVYLAIVLKKGVGYKPNSVPLKGP